MPTRPLKPNRFAKTASLFFVAFLFAFAYFGWSSSTRLSAAPPGPSQQLAQQPAGEALAERIETQPHDPLLAKIEQAVQDTSRRFLDADRHTPWQIMHGILAFRADFMIRQNSQEINAVAWLSKDPKYQGDHWFEKTNHGGRAHPFSTRYAFEGHPNQFLAVIAMANLPLDHTLETADGPITVSDMVRHAQAHSKAGEEVAWSLWALSHYLGSDGQWQNMYGEAWSVERLAQIQMNEPTSTAACGGSHGLFGLSYARNKALEKDKQLRGVWLEADQHIKRYMATAKNNQNSDGSFSTEFFQGRGVGYDFAKRLATSGHTLEFLILAASDSDLQQPWIRKGTDRMAQDLIDHRSDPIDVGPLYHAINGLVIYRDRMNQLNDVVGSASP